MIGARVAALAGLLPAIAACMGPGDFHCTEHAQCTIGNVAGTCEANGHCSLPVRDCAPSYRRYAHHAGGDADLCVPASCEDNAVTQVSAGGGHACLLRADRSLWCWGRNDRGQIGDGTRTPRALPVRVAGIGEVEAVAAGDLHTCAVTIAGDVFCWGAGDSGQLGDPSGGDRGLPQPLAGVTALAGVPGTNPIAAGRDFSCALGADRIVRCWGDDSVGQLGDGGAPGPHPPTVVAGLSADVARLSAQWQHACALDTVGKLACWGANASGQIGDGTSGGARPPTTPSAPLPAQVTAIATGRDHTCALAGGDNDIYCWGANAQGQVNPGAPSMPIPTPTPVSGPDLTDPKDIAGGGQHTCIVRKGEKNPITCWGANTSGQLGEGTPMEDATLVAAGAAFTCGLGKDGAIQCWGDNHYGQLAIGGDVVRATPAPVPGLAHVGALAAGGAHNCATADDTNGARALFCWGANGSSQLGDLSSTDAPEATRVSSLQPIGIAAGRAHTCAFAADKELRCWGWGASGQLGQAPGNDMVVTSPAITDLGGPGGGDGVYAVAAGASHTCVGATISASVLCFGLNSDGQLGNGMQGVPGGPDPVPSLLGKPKMLAAGDAHTCALDGGTIWCWGRGDEGQLGDARGVEHPSPTAVSLGNGVTADAVVAGAAHTCALAGGRIICWGRNTDGQVGAPLQMPLLDPTPVNAISQASAVAAGARHTCAILADATVSCWGANESGQLGNGTIDSSNVPVQVFGLTNVDAIVAGGAHSCARRTDGTVWCWGANTSGQLGDGITLSSPSPLVARVACP